MPQWDSSILSNRRALLELEEELRRVVRGQESLERKLQMLETHQKGIHDALVGMEGEAERLYKEERPLLDDDSRWGGRRHDGCAAYRRCATLLACSSYLFAGWLQRMKEVVLQCG